MSGIYDFLAPVIGAGASMALLAVLILLILGRFRKYWIVFIYVSWELLATLGFTIADVLYHGSSPSTPATRTLAQMWYSRAYWTNDVIVDLFRFVLVIVLIYRASPEGLRRVSGRFLAALLILMVVLPFVLFDREWRVAPEDPLGLPFPRAHWFNSTSQLLNFGAAIMNLMLWATLVASKRRDPELLGVSVGLGIVVTGTALGYGLKHLPGFASISYLFLNLTQLAGWLIWVRTFWVARNKKQNSELAAPAR